MKICIKVQNKTDWDDAQRACFKNGWDWERFEYVNFFEDDYKDEESFVLNDDGWHETISHLCVLDGILCTSYQEDGNPEDDGYTLKTIKELNAIR